VENYLKIIATKEKKVEEPKMELPDFLKSARGSVKLPKDFDYKKELQEALIEKHWKR
jgi:hypothetical protein